MMRKFCREEVNLLVFSVAVIGALGAAASAGFVCSLPCWSLSEDRFFIIKFLLAEYTQDSAC